MKTVFQINTVVNSGPTGRIVEGIGLLAIENGWNSYIAYGRLPNISSSKTIRIGSRYDMIFHGIETRLFDNHCFASRQATKELIDCIELIKPDIIHLHNLHGYYLNVEMLFNYLSMSESKVVWTLHDCWTFTGHCCYFSFVNCDKWKIGCNNCVQKKDYPKSMLLDRSRENYFKKKTLFNSLKSIEIVTVSNWLKDIVKESFLSKYPISVINNGIDINVFKFAGESNIYKRYGLEDKQIIMGCANGWTLRKGFQDFLDLSSMINKSQHIVLVGLDSNQIKNLPNNVLGIGKINDIEDLVALYSSAHVFLNLSHEETFGLVTIESLSCGTPVIVYNSTASPELISSECGRVVDDGDIISVKNAIQELLSLNQTELSKACRLRVERLYNRDDKFSEYIKLYESLLINSFIR